MGIIYCTPWLKKQLEADLIYDWDIDAAGITPGFKNNNRAALQTFINTSTAAGHGCYISVPHGIDVTGLTIPSNANIRFVGDGALKLLPYAANAYNMLNLNGVSNVLICDAVLYGSKELNGNAPSGVDNGMGINIVGACLNIGIVKPQIRDCWGDGIYIGAGNASGVEIISPRITGVRRNGISVTSSTGLIIADALVEYVRDAAPKAAIEFIPSSNADKLSGIQVIGFQSVRCQNSLAFNFQNLPGATAQVVDITVSGLVDIGCLDTVITQSNLFKGSNSVSGNIAINSPKYVHSNNAITSSSWDNSVVVAISASTSIA